MVYRIHVDGHGIVGKHDLLTVAMRKGRKFMQGTTIYAGPNAQSRAVAVLTKRTVYTGLEHINGPTFAYMWVPHRDATEEERECFTLVF